MLNALLHAASSPSKLCNCQIINSRQGYNFIHSHKHSDPCPNPPSGQNPQNQGSMSERWPNCHSSVISPDTFKSLSVMSRREQRYYSARLCEQDGINPFPAQHADHICEHYPKTGWLCIGYVHCKHQCGKQVISLPA